MAGRNGAGNGKARAMTLFDLGAADGAPDVLSGPGGDAPIPGCRLMLGDCLELMGEIEIEGGSVDAVVADPPYGMDWDTDSTRFSGGRRRERAGRRDWGAIEGDDRPFDPTPWLRFPKVILWGANHYAGSLPVGTTLVWIKRADHLFGSFLSDAEIGWMKGGHGVYCHREQFPPPSRMCEGGGKVLHPSQKPVGLVRWCIERLNLRPGDTVLDPYMGSGTTGIAAIGLGLNFIGIEVDPRRFRVARRRLARAARLMSPFLPAGGTS